MKNQSVLFSLFAIILFVVTFSVVSMEQPAKKAKTIEYEDPTYRKLVALRSQLVHFLYSDEYDDKDGDDRRYIAKNLNDIIKNPLIYYQIPNEQVDFTPVIREVANRYSLSKIGDKYVAYPRSTSVPRRK